MLEISVCFWSSLLPIHVKELFGRSVLVCIAYWLMDFIVECLALLLLSKVHQMSMSVGLFFWPLSSLIEGCTKMPLLVIFYYIKNTPKCSSLKQQPILFQSFCITGIWVWLSCLLCFWVSHKLQSRCWPGL